MTTCAEAASPLALMREHMALADGELRRRLPQAASEDQLLALAADLLTLAEDVSSRLRDVAPVRPLACRAGCDHCCRNMIQVRPLFAILAVATAMARFEPARMADFTDRLVKGTPFCPFLFDGQCSIYDARPMVCRGYYSLDLARCLEGDFCEKTLGYQGDDAHAAHQLMVFLFALEKRIEAIEAELGLEQGLVLLDQAARILLARPDSARRWQQGERVFTAP